MEKRFRVNLIHYLENGDKIELKTCIDSPDIGYVEEKARKQFSQAVKYLSASNAITVDRIKIKPQK